MKKLIDPWVIAGSLGVAVLLLAGLLYLMGPVTRPPEPDFSGGIELTIIPHPTSTPIPLSTATAEAVTPTPASNTGIEVGSHVRIQGTGGEGLRLRANPSLAAETNYVGLEDEVFRVLEGPREGDNYLWWLLEAPANPSRNGWAVSNYLITAQGPGQ